MMSATHRRRRPSKPFRTTRRYQLESLEDRRMLAAAADFNADGLWDTLDIDELTTAISTESADLTYDLDADGQVANGDLDSWRSLAAAENGFADPYLLGDANLDGRVDSLDLNALASNWTSENRAWSQGDFIPNGTIDSSDLNAIGAHWLEEIQRRPEIDRPLFSTDGYNISRGPNVVIEADFNGDNIADFVTVSAFESRAIVHLGTGDGSFQAQEKIFTGSNPRSVAVSDFNGDGVADIATANTGSLEFPGFDDDVSILLGNGDGSFQPPTRFVVGFNPISLSTGDLNGDGIADLVTANRSTRDISILIGQGDGSFAPEQRLPFDPGGFVAPDDFNGDGVADLMTATGVVLGQGDGSFTEGERLDLGNSVAVSDFDGDGLTDVVATDSITGDIAVRLQQQDGTFQQGNSIPTAGTTLALTVVDFDGDGKPDVAAAASNFSNRGDGSVSILLGGGDGSLSLKTTIDSLLDPSSLAAADFDGDGAIDLATTTGHPTDEETEELKYTGTILLQMGNGDGTFTESSALRTPVGTDPQEITTQDFNQDNIPDVAVTNSDSNDVSILLGRNDGTFEQQPYLMGVHPVDSVFADFDGDGTLDMATANRDSADIQVRLGNGDGTFGNRRGFDLGGTPNAITSGDFNGDGIIDLATSNSQDVALLFGRGDGSFDSPQNLPMDTPRDVTSADVNNDGVVDLVTTHSLFDGESGLASVWLGRGNGTFEARLDSPTGGFPASPTVGDFDGNGHLDIAVITINSTCCYTDFGNLSIALAAGDGTFSPAQVYSVGDAGRHPSSLTIGDFNQDGVTDIATANAGTGYSLGPENVFVNSSDISVFLGLGEGTFDSERSYAVDSVNGPAAIATNDFNGDGVSDLVVTNGETNDISVILGINDNPDLEAIEPTMKQPRVKRLQRAALTHRR